MNLRSGSNEKTEEETTMIKLQGLSREQVREIARQIADSCDDGADIPEYGPLSIPS